MIARRLLASLALATALAGPVDLAAAQAGGDAAAPTGGGSSSGADGRSSALVDLEDEVMCIVCKRPLSTSGGDAADEERSVIQGYLDQGLTKDQVKDRLVAEYGDAVLVTGSTPATAAIPVLVAIVGVLSIGLLLRSRRRRDGTGDATEPADPGATASEGVATSPAGPGRHSAADEARIDAELAERG